MEPPKSPEKKAKKSNRKGKVEEAPAPEPEAASPAKPKKKQKGGRKSKGGDE